MADHIWVVRSPEGRVIGAAPTRDNDLHAGQYRAVESAFAHGRVMTKDEEAAYRALDDLVDNTMPCDRYEHNGYTLTREPLPASVAASEPVAWGVANKDGVIYRRDLFLDEGDAFECACYCETHFPLQSPWELVPLYRHPSAAGVTDAQIEAAAKAIQWHQSIPTIRYWDKTPDHVRDRYRDVARAALTAAREVQP